MESYTFAWTHMEPVVCIARHGCIRIYMEHMNLKVFGLDVSTWNHMNPQDPYATLWIPMFAICIHITYGLHGFIWLFTDPYVYID
jgi:hypothetical protein